MDVVNGKIVAARAERLTDAWSGLKPSSARVVDGRRESIHGKPDQRPCSSLRGQEWAPSWATPYASWYSDESPLNAWGGAAPGHGPSAGLALEPGPARWNRPSSEKVHAGALHDYCGLQPQPFAEHRQGWERSSAGLTVMGRGGDQRHYHFKARPCSETKFDEEMTMYESQITRAVSGHFSEAVVTSLGQEISTPPAESPALSLAESVDGGTAEKISKQHSLQRSASDAAPTQDSETQSSPNSTLVGTRSDLKRKRSEFSENDQADCGWNHPLKLLIRKGLSLSDVGELGRIVIPKKDAESRFPPIDTKEGLLLEMEDYTASKRWFFRFKWWINNKSRMYLLENTGEFVKYHSLKEHDIFVVYEDSSRKMVVRGHKGTDLDSTLDLVQGTHAKSSNKSSSAKAILS